MTSEQLIRKFSKLAFLRSFEFQSLPQEKKNFILEIIEDAIFWIDLEKKEGPKKDDGFKFLAAAYGLNNATLKANEQGLTGKEREKFLRPHQDLFTMFNPYSGNGQES